MPDRDRQSNIGLLIMAGIGTGALAGALLGLLTARRAGPPGQAEIGETVDDLKRRAEQILTELSQTHAAPEPPR